MKAKILVLGLVLATIATIPVGKGMAGLAVERGRPVDACNLQTDASGDYAAANSDEQLELRVCMHKIVLPSSLQREAELYYYRRHRKTCDLFHDFLKRSSIQIEELLCTVQL